MTGLSAVRGGGFAARTSILVALEKRATRLWRNPSTAACHDLCRPTVASAAAAVDAFLRQGFDADRRCRRVPIRAKYCGGPHARHAMAGMATATPSRGGHGARLPLVGGSGKGGPGRVVVPIFAPPAVLCPPTSMLPVLSPTYNLKRWCEEVGGELGGKLLEEWDDPILVPWEVTRASSKRARWRCRTCGWKWVAPVYSRTRSTSPSGCPACAGHVATETHNLALTCEESRGRLAHLPGEWNHSTKRMEDFTPASNAKVPWRCRTCEGAWDTKISHRTDRDRPSGCPACSGHVAKAKKLKTKEAQNPRRSIPKKLIEL